MRVWIFPLVIVAPLVAIACRSAPNKAAVTPSSEAPPAVSAAPAIAPPRPAAPPSVVAYQVDPTRSEPSRPETVARGAKIYERQCSACHGATGLADGPAAYLLYPKPRNLRRAQYRFISTWDGTATDADLYRTISRGIPGSAMPSWAHLPETDRWALVHFVKSLAEDPLEVVASKEPDVAAGIDGEGVVIVPKEPAYDPVRGAAVFTEVCVPCHGARGQGDGANSDKLKDSENRPIRPRDLTTGVFKGTPRPELIYRRVVAGIPGTPMPASPVLHGADAWQVTRYVLGLSSDRQREQAEMRRVQIVAERVASLPQHPDSGEWRKVPSVNLHLMPLWWRYKRPEYVTVQAVHDGNELAIILVWSDDTHDQMAIRPEDYRDGAAIQFALAPDPPFFAMGEAASAVNIWMWKSERQADLAGFHDVEAQYPNVGIDSYPSSVRAPYEQPLRNALTVDSDPRFVTAWGAGNIVADPTRKSAAEDLSAHGFGTLRARPRTDQAVEANGVYSTGSYRIMFKRALVPKGDGAVALSAGQTVPVAVAVWNGSAGDRDGKKSVTIWQELVLAP